MTLESAIKHAEQVVVREDNNAQVYDKVKNDNLYHPDKITCEQAAKRCRECAAEHRQLAEWLKILKSAKFEYDEAWRTITHPTPDVTYADKQRAQVILDKFRNSLGAISALQTQDFNDTNVGDTVSRQAAIDALCRRCDLVAEDDESCTEKCNDIKILEKLPSARTENTDCIYCHEDSDGYVKPIEKNCHAFIRFGMDGWEISLSAKGWHGGAKIRYCPMCGRDLLVK